MTRALRTTAGLVGLVGLAACGGGDGDGKPAAAAPAPPPPVVTVLASDLVRPRDLAFNSRIPDELWIVNGNGSVAIVHGATNPKTAKTESRRDRNYLHFMPDPSSLAFGGDATNLDALDPALAPGTFATCQESRNGGDNLHAGNDFMGPVLWSSDLSIFALKNGMLGSHLDMLHQSPLCMGIAWEGSGNVYWTFNGLARSIDRYDFQKDHGIGNDNHDDGLIHRFSAGQLGYVEGVPSHLAFRREESAVYLADTGKGRVLKLTYEKARKLMPMPAKQDEAESWIMADETLIEIVPAAAGILTRPSGLEIHGDQLFVSDNANGDIVRLSLSGTLIARYPTGVAAGGLAGLAFGPDDKLYFVDMVGNQVQRFDGPL